MKTIAVAPTVAVLASLSWSLTVHAEKLTFDEFRRDLVGVPLCGTPAGGPLAGKAVCTVHFANGTVVVSGAGLRAEGIWEADQNRICRRDLGVPPEERRCVEYEATAPGRYRNSDGVEFCVGPCP